RSASGSRVICSRSSDRSPRPKPCCRACCRPIALPPMVAWSQLVTFAGLAFVMVALPGPSVLFAVGRALTVGRRAALLTVVGNAAGVYAQVVAVAFGLGAVVTASATVFTAIKLAGALYLVYLG